MANEGRDKYGFPTKKKTMTAKTRRFKTGAELLNETKASMAKKAAGIEDREEPSFLGEVGNQIKSAPSRMLDAVTPAIFSKIKNRNKEIEDAAKDTTTEPVKRAGGQIKSKPRGVGVAQRGHGKVGRK